MANADTRIIVVGGVNVLAALWLMVDPFVFGYPESSAAQINDVLVGFAIVVLAVIRSFGGYRQGWLGWVNALFGVWLIAAPFVLGYSTYTVAMVNNVVVGTIVAALAAWSAIESRAFALS